MNTEGNSSSTAEVAVHLDQVIRIGLHQNVTCIGAACLHPDEFALDVCEIRELPRYLLLDVLEASFSHWKWNASDDGLNLR